MTSTIPTDHFPALLREMHDPPAHLFVRGTLPPQDTLCLSVVGSRRMTRYGEEAIRALVEPVARAGVCIVSGLAFGVDVEAHRAALRVGAGTIAVMPGGLDDASIAPRTHLNLALDIVAHGGALVGEHPDGTPTHAGSFPVRNRLIAAIAKATLVVEGTLKSGTMVTAALALRENREVLCVPGPIHAPQSQAPLDLIRRGATLVRTADDIFEALGISHLAQTLERNIPDDCRPVADLLRAQPRTVDQLALALNAPAAQILTQLSQLELLGVAASTDRYNFHLTV